MRHTRGLTLLESATAIIAIAALAALLLLASCKSRGGRGHAQMTCLSNLNAIAKALCMYAEDPNNDGQWPWINGTNWNCPTGTNDGKAPPAPGQLADDRAITALPFLLIRERLVTPEDFICPGEDGVTEQKDLDFEKNYDFGHAAHVSYSYAAPILTPAGTWKSGAGETVAKPALVAVLADRNPAMAGGGSGPWADKISETQRKSWISPNHGGNIINVAWLDFHVSRETRADIGVDKDCIYTAGGQAGPSRAATSTELRDHRVESDSFLVGPYK